MTYTYKYKDGDKEVFDVSHSMKEPALTEHNGRPCSRVITGGSGTVFRGIWNDNAHEYTRLGFGPGGTKDIGNVN